VPAVRGRLRFRSGARRSVSGGVSLLQKERYAEARAVFATIPPVEYDLGDYVVYFGGEPPRARGSGPKR